MNSYVDIVIPFKENLQEGINTYKKLISLYHLLNSGKYKRIGIDFKGVKFVSANLLSLFGGILEQTQKDNDLEIMFNNIHPNVQNVMRKNGFGQYFKFEPKEDIFHSTIEYRKFSPTTQDLEEFERYIGINVFQRGFLPVMDQELVDAMIDNILEMFNNVIDHAESDVIYVCGQFFPKKKKMILTMTDLGKTIQGNVQEYAEKQGINIKNSLEWALVLGNTTKLTYTPGGLGLSLMLNFLELNKGAFTLISADECFELNLQGKRRFLTLEEAFPGTVLTITINLDDKMYFLVDNNENDNIIVF